MLGGREHVSGCEPLPGDQQGRGAQHPPRGQERVGPMRPRQPHADAHRPRGVLPGVPPGGLGQDAAQCRRRTGVLQPRPDRGQRTEPVERPGLAQLARVAVGTQQPVGVGDLETSGEHPQQLDPCGRHPATEHPKVPQRGRRDRLLGLDQRHARAQLVSVRCLGKPVECLGKRAAGRERRGGGRAVPAAGHRPRPHASGHPARLHRAASASPACSASKRTAATATATSSERVWSAACSMSRARCSAAALLPGPRPRRCRAPRPPPGPAASLRRGGPAPPGPPPPVEPGRDAAGPRRPLRAGSRPPLRPWSPALRTRRPAQRLAPWGGPRARRLPSLRPVWQPDGSAAAGHACSAHGKPVLDSAAGTVALVPCALPFDLADLRTGRVKRRSGSRRSSASSPAGRSRPR